MELLKREFLFFIFLFLLIIFIYQNPQEIYNFYDYINWPTIRAIFVLLIITTALKISNFFDLIATKYIYIFKNEKFLALFFVILTALFAMFLTNDITLFIIVPITIAISNVIENDITKLVIFEAIAANVGSLLTPIGNPQNLYIFRLENISFFNFINQMFPIFIIKFGILIIFTLIVFSNKKLIIKPIKSPKTDIFLFFSGIMFFSSFIIALEFNLVKFLIPIILLYFSFTNILKKVDYFLVITFILMFIDFNIIAKIEIIKNFIESINLNFLNSFNLSVIISQFMSNVPATIFMTKFSDNYQAIIYGTNVAGSGIIISSFANIIAIRLLKRGYLDYHKYGIPYFLVTYLLIFFLLLK